MRISDLLQMGFKNLWRRKSRTLLTVFGVLVGSVSVVMMISIALGSERESMKMMESFGNIKVIDVSGKYKDFNKYYMPEEQGGGNSKASDSDDDSKDLNEEALEKIKALPNIEAITPVYEANMQFKMGRLEAYSGIVACDLETLEKMGLVLVDGKMPQKGDREIVFGGALEHNFYDPKASDQYDRNWDDKTEVINQTLMGYLFQQTDKNGNKKKPIRITPVGKADEDSVYGWQNYMDLDTFKTLLVNDIRKNGNFKAYKKDKHRNDYNKIKVLAKTVDDVEKLTQDIKDLGFKAQNRLEFAEAVKKQTGIISLILGGIGGVALFVAAIGIANTMVMSIYERTREIGVMKVLGAEVFDILKLFLLEAGAIGFTGGVIGLGISYAGSNFINNLVGKNPDFAGMELSYIPLWLALVSILFATMIGVVAGILPAIRATRLSALEAIKND